MGFFAHIDEAVGISSTFTSVSTALADLEHDVSGGLADFEHDRNVLLANFDSTLGVSATITAIAKDPLPVLATIGLTWLGVPPYLSAALVTAARGGSMEDIVKSAAMAYISGKVGNYAGTTFAGSDFATNTLSPELAKTLTTIVTSASGDMAVAALQQRPLNEVLAAGMNSAVTSYVTQGLTKQLGLTDPKLLSTKIASSAISSATNAILNGKDVGKAITQSVVQTALSEGIKTGVDTIVKNSTTIQGLITSFNDAKKSAEDYFTKTLNPQYDKVNTTKATADASRAAVQGVASDYKTKYDAYIGAKAYAEGYVQPTKYTLLQNPMGGHRYEHVPVSGSKTKEQVIATVNAMVPGVNAAGDTFKSAMDKASTDTEAYNTAVSNYNPLVSAYEGLANLASSAFGTLETKTTEQNTLITKVATDTTAYEAETEKQAGVVANALGADALAEAKKVAIDNPIADAYKTALGRDASASEISSWAQQVASKGIDSVVSSINNSPEAATYRETTAKAVGFPDYETSNLYGGNISSYKAIIDPIKQEYQKQLGRNVTDAELKTLVTAVENVGYPAVVRGIADSSEAKNYKASNEGIDADTLESNKTSADQQIQNWIDRSPVVKSSWAQIPSLKPGEDMTTLMKSAPKVVTDALNKDLIKNSSNFDTAYAMARTAYGGNKTFEWTNPDTGKTSSFTTNTKQEVALQPYDASSLDMSRSGLGGAAQSALNAGKTSFIWNDGKTYKVPDAYAFLKGADQSSAENKRLLEAGVAPVKPNGQTALDNVIGRAGVGAGNMLADFGKSIALATGDANYKNAVISAGNMLAQWGENKTGGTDLATQVNNLEAGVAAAGNAKDVFSATSIFAKTVINNPVGLIGLIGSEGSQEAIQHLIGGAAGVVVGVAVSFFATPVAGYAAGAATYKGVMALTEGAMVWGSTGQEIEQALVKKGVPVSEARNKALMGASAAALVAIPAEYIADKAVIGAWMNGIKGGIKEYAIKYGTSTGTQMVSGMIEGASQSAITQYQSTGNVNMVAAVASGYFEAVVGAATGAAMVSPAAIRDLTVIGKDFSGSNVTFRDFLSGDKTVNPNTFNTTISLGKSDGGADLTLGSFTAMGVQMGFDTETLSSLLPPSLTSDSTIIGIDADGTSHTLGQIKQEVADGSSADLAIKNVFDDAKYVTQNEGVDLYQSAFGTLPTPAQLQAFIGKPEAEVQQAINADQTALSKERETTYRVEAAKQTDLAEAARLAGDGAGQAAAENASAAAKAKADQIKALDTVHPEMVADKTPSEITAEKILAMTSDSGAVKDLRYDLDKDGKITAKDAVLGSSGTEVRTDIRADGTTAYATTKEIQDAIAGIQFPAGITPADVTQAITNYMTANPGLTLQQVAEAITTGTTGLATDAGVKTSISTALKGVATTADVNAAIAGIKFPVGLTKADVAAEIKAAMEASPGLSATDVASAISTYMTANPAVTAAQLQTAVTNATKNLATKSDVETAIKNIQFPAGITSADVSLAITNYMKANPGLTLQQVAEAITTGTSGLATDAGVKTSISNALKGVATTADVNAAIAGIKFPAGLTKADVAAEIKTAMAANPGLSAADVTKSITDYMTKNPALTKADVTSVVNTEVNKLNTSIATLRSDLSSEIDAAIASGLEGDAALQKGLNTLSTKVGTNQTALLSKIGATEATLKSDFATKISGLETKLTEAIAAAQASGLEGDAALKTAIEKVAKTQQTDSASLLKQIGTTEANLSKQFAIQLTGLDTKLTAAIAEAKASGLAGDKALQAAINKVAATQQTDSASLLKSIGTTEANLKTLLTSQLSSLEDKLSNEIDAAVASGLSGDAALQKGLDTLSAKVGTNQTELLSQIGKSADALKTQFTNQISSLDTKLSAEIDAAIASGLKGDAALQKGLDALSTKMRTNQAALLTQLGKSTADLKTQFSTQISGLKAEVAQTEKDILAQVALNEKAGMTRDAALQEAINTVATAQGTDTAALTSKISSLGTTLGKEINALQADLAQTEKDILAEVALNEKAGMKRDAAIQEAINTVAATQKTDAATLTSKISGLGTTLSKEISTLQADLAQTEKDILAQVAVNEKAGMTRDAALQSAINTVAAAQKTDTATLTSKISGLGTTLGKEIDAVQADLAQTEKDILKEVSKNEAAGLSRDVALQKAIQTVATTQQKSTTDILSKLNTTAAGLNTKITGIQTELAQTEKDILAQVAVNEKAGMTRDAALQKAINTVATTQSTDTASLLTKLGKTEETLKTQFSTQVTSLDTKLSAAIADAKAAGLKGDAALQSAIDKVASDQQTTAADILTQMGKSTAELKTQFASDISGLTAEVQAKYDALSQAQKNAVDAQVQQGKDLTLAITESAAGLQTQISGLSAEMQTQYGALTQAQKDAVDAQVQQGKDLTKAITDTASGLQTQITGLGADAQAKYDALSAAQKLEVDARVQQGTDLTSAINAAQTKTETQIGTLSADLQTKYDALTKSDQAIVNTQIQQGIDTKTAIENATKAININLDTRINTVTNSITDVQTQFNIRVDELVKEGKSYQDATKFALGELDAGILGLQSSVTDIKAAQTAEIARVAAEKAAATKAANAKAAQQKMTAGLTAGASLLGLGRGSSSSAVEPARPMLQTGLTSTGGDTKFESVLGSFIKDAEAGFYDPKQPNEQQQQAAPAKKELDMQNPQGDTNYFAYGSQEDINEVLAENPGTQMLYSKSGGLATPFFANGGNSNRQSYAGGGLNVIHHEGKPRIDFRTGNAVTGPGDGQSDDIPAMLADGEFVFPADVVSALGNGSTKAGSDKLYDMMHSIRAYHRSAKPKDLPPAAKKSPLDYLKKTA